MDSILRVKDLSVRFDSHQVLDGLSFQINRGEVVSIIGRSGSGKTVLLRTLAKLQAVSAGQIEYDFRKNNSNPVGYAFQKSPLFPWLSVVDNLRLCTPGLDKALDYDLLLKQVGLAEYKNHFPKDISAGMAQKVNLLRALSNGCELILMDEPFASLDGFQRSELQQFTHDFCRRDEQSILLITHDIDEALLLSDRILILSSVAGRIRDEIKVSLPKPEVLSEMRSYDQYGALYKRVLDSLLAPDGDRE